VGKSPPRWKNLLEDENEINDDIFFCFWFILDDAKIGENVKQFFRLNFQNNFIICSAVNSFRQIGQSLFGREVKHL